MRLGESNSRPGVYVTFTNQYKTLLVNQNGVILIFGEEKYNNTHIPNFKPRIWLDCITSLIRFGLGIKKQVLDLDILELKLEIKIQLSEFRATLNRVLTDKLTELNTPLWL